MSTLLDLGGTATPAGFDLQGGRGLGGHMVFGVNIPHLGTGSICGRLGSLSDSSTQAPGC